MDKSSKKSKENAKLVQVLRYEYLTKKEEEEKQKREKEKRKKCRKYVSFVTECSPTKMPAIDMLKGCTVIKKIQKRFKSEKEC